MAIEIEDWLAENYDGLVKANRRTYADIEAAAEKSGDRSLAAWARKRAESSTSTAKRTADPRGSKHEA